MRTAWVSIIVITLFLVSCNPGNNKKTSDGGSADSLTSGIDDLNKLISENSSDPDLFHKRARLYLLKPDLDLALKDLNSAITLSPGNPSYYITLSDVYLLRGETKNCEGSLAKALSVDPFNNEALLKLAKLKLIVREYPAVFENVKKALAAEPLNPRAYFIRAIALLETGDTVRAVGDLKKTVDQDQEFFEAYLELGELYSMKKDKIAADYLRNALNIRPDNKDALYLLGMFYQETGQYEKAIDTYAILGKVDTTFRNAPYNTGYIYLVYLNDFKKAIIFFSQALRRDPEYAEAYYNRGYAYELSGQIEKAYSDYKSSLRLVPNYQKAVDALNRLDKIILGKNQSRSE
jgi:tetratricopeptide (TPR) repeat protein